MPGQLERCHKMVWVGAEEVSAKCNQVDLVHDLWSDGVLDAETVHVDEVPAHRDLVVAVPASDQDADEPTRGLDVVLQAWPLVMAVHQDFIGPATAHPAPDQRLL